MRKEFNTRKVFYIMAFPKGCTLCGSHWHTAAHCPMRGA